jgi:hypothetical protein
MYSLRSELKRIWILFAWYSLVSYFSHTWFICFIRLYSLKNIRFNSLRKMHLEALLPTVTAHCFCPLSSVQCLLSIAHSALPTVHCPLFNGPLFTAHCLLPTVYYPLYTVQCLLPNVYWPELTVHCRQPTVHCPLPTVKLFTEHCLLPTVLLPTCLLASSYYC